MFREPAPPPEISPGRYFRYRKPTHSRRESWGRVHLQIIYFGREHCPALWHDLAACPICSWAATGTRKREEAERQPAGPGAGVAAVKVRASSRWGSRAVPRSRGPR